MSDGYDSRPINVGGKAVPFWAVLNHDNAMKAFHAQLERRGTVEQTTAAEFHSLHAIADHLADAKREGVREMSPDFLMGEDGEVGFPASDLGDLADDLNLDPGEVRRVLAYRQLPDRWLAHVVLTRDSDGAPDETEPQLFDSEAEALAALAEKCQP